MKADSGSRRHAEAIPLQPDAARTAMTSGTACGRLSFSRHRSECVSEVMSQSSAKIQNIPYDNMTIELSRRTRGRPSRTTRIDTKIYLDAELSDEQKQGILQAADCCHITDSIKEGMQIACSLADAEADNVQE